MTTSSDEIRKQIEKAISAHEQWKGRLLKAIEQEHSELDVDTIAHDGLCEFGHWLKSEVSDKYRASDNYIVVEDLHARFHSVAAEVIVAVKENDIFAARAILHDQYRLISSSLRFALELWRTSLEEA